MPPSVAVVIPVYNDQDHLETALGSARAQSLADLEIVVIDHGSTDDTPAILARAAELDRRIRVITLDDDRGGPGRPMNVGLRAVTAPWLTILGSDDELMPDACEGLLERALSTQADVVLGRTDRMHLAEGGRVQIWAKRLFRSERFVPRLACEPELLGDTIAAGKLYRTEFLRDAGIEFPEDVVYEDQLFSAKVLTAAEGIAVTDQPVYRWMVRRGMGRQSLSNSREDIKNFADRLIINERVDEHLAALGDSRLMRAKNAKFLTHDLRLYLDDADRWTQEYRDAFVQLAGDYLRRLRVEDLAEVPPMVRVTAGLLRAGRLHDALVAWNFRRLSGPPPVQLRRDGDRVRWGVADTDPELDEWLDVTSLGLHRLRFAAKALRVSLLSSRLTGGVIEVEGTVSDPVDPDASLASAVLHLVRRGTTHAVALPTTITEVRSHATRFRVRADLATLPPSPGSGSSRSLSTGYWDLYLHCRRGTEVNLTRIVAAAASLQSGSVELPGLVSPWRWHVTKRGYLSLRVDQVMPPRAGLGSVITVAALTSSVRRTAGRIRVRQRHLVVFGEHPADRGMASALADQLSRLHPELEQAWLPIPERVRYATAPPGSEQTLTLWDAPAARALLRRAQTWVIDGEIPVDLAKPEGTRYLRLAGELPAPSAATESAASRWDYLVVPDRWAERVWTGVGPQAIRLGLGDPARAVMAAVSEEYAAVARRLLALPRNRLVAWHRPDPSSEQVDYVLLSDRLSPSWVWLTDQGDPNPTAAEAPRLVRPISANAGVRDVIMVCDVVVAGRPGEVFDAASLGIPVVLWPPRQTEAWSSPAAGELLAAPPGPVVGSQAELVARLQEIQSDPDHWQSVAHAFYRRWRNGADDRAAERIINVLWPT